MLPGNMWDSLLIIIRPVQVDGGVLRLQIADGGTSQEKEDTSSQDSQEEEEEAGVNSQEGTAEELELDLKNERLIASCCSWPSCNYSLITGLIL